MDIKRFVKVSFLLLLHINIMLFNSYPISTDLSGMRHDPRPSLFELFIEESVEINDVIPQGEESETSHENAKFSETEVEYLVSRHGISIPRVYHPGSRTDYLIAQDNLITRQLEVVAEPPESA